MKILYLCDRRACETCHTECNHTEDIRHARNFQMTAGGTMREIEPDVIECTSELVADATFDAEQMSALAAEIGRVCADGIRSGMGIK